MSVLVGRESLTGENWNDVSGQRVRIGNWNMGGGRAPLQ